MNCSSQSLIYYYIMNSISIRAQHISILFYFHTFQLLTFSAGRIFLESYNCISHYWVNQLSLFAAPLAIGDNSRGPISYIKPDDSSQKSIFALGISTAVLTIHFYIMRSQAFYERVGHLRIKLAPLASLSHATVHPDFPETILHYHLLTEEQLDALARFYDQCSPTTLTKMYPACMNWDKTFLASLDDSSIRVSKIATASYSIFPEENNAGDMHMVTSPITPKQLSPRSTVFAATSSPSSQTALGTQWDGPAWVLTLPYNVPGDDFIRKAAAAVTIDAADDMSTDGSNENETEMRKRLAREIRIAMKRRMFGKFIGLRGMDTPIEEVSMKLKFLEARFWQLVALDRVADASPQKVA